MLNLVTGPADRPSAILIRGVEGISGPGRLTRTLAINRDLNGTAAGRKSGLWLEDRGVRVPRGALRATPRIGVAYAGPVWSKKPWRFTFDANAAGIDQEKDPFTPSFPNLMVRNLSPLRTLRLGVKKCRRDRMKQRLGLIATVTTRF
jgi:3-methyladenine DNA glycosylase Mpg